MILRSNQLYIFALIGLLLVQAETMAINTSMNQTQQLIGTLIRMKAGNKVLSGAVLVAQGDTILFQKAYGMANYEHDIPNTVDTVFRIASLTKQFTGVAILQLCERGLLALEDTIDKYVPDYKEAQRITIYQLLTHTAGLVQFPGFPPGNGVIDMNAPRGPQIINYYKDHELIYEPGTRFSYSNLGYIILSAIVEQVSGLSYEAYIHEYLFKPAGMTNSGYDHPTSIVRNRAAGYKHSDGTIYNAQFIDLEQAQGAGGLYSTLGDLYKWDRALYGGTLLSKETLVRWCTPRVPAFEESQEWYSYGICVTQDEQQTLLFHRGELYGFRTRMVHRLPDNLCIIFLSNNESHNPKPIVDGILAFLSA